MNALDLVNYFTTNGFEIKNLETNKPYLDINGNKIKLI